MRSIVVSQCRIMGEKGYKYVIENAQRSMNVEIYNQNIFPDLSRAGGCLLPENLRIAFVAARGGGERVFVAIRLATTSSVT